MTVGLLRKRWLAVRRENHVHQVLNLAQLEIVNAEDEVSKIVGREDRAGIAVEPDGMPPGWDGDCFGERRGPRLTDVQLVAEEWAVDMKPRCGTRSKRHLQCDGLRLVRMVDKIKLDLRTAPPPAILR